MPSKGILVVMLECTPICLVVRRGRQKDQLEAVACALCSRVCTVWLFYPVLKGIRSAHEAFIKDTLCVNG